MYSDNKIPPANILILAISIKLRIFVASTSITKKYFFSFVSKQEFKYLNEEIINLFSYPSKN
jgi:hypothetical protein